MVVNSINLDVADKAILWGDLKLGGKNPAGDSFETNSYYITHNGRPFFAICGEFHFSRCPSPCWEDELLKMKAAGINIISTYVFWNHHEETEGHFDWSDNKDVRRFLELCAAHGLYVVLRIGPFAHGEVRNGGFPDWLYGRPFTVRTNDDGYLYYARRLYDEIGKQVAGLLFKDNGPVIGIQLENEHMASSAPWDFMIVPQYEWIGGGSGGAEHIRTLKALALAAGLEAPIYTCTGWDGGSFIEDETLPVFGGYCWEPWVEGEASNKPTGNCLIIDYHKNNVTRKGFTPAPKGGKYPFACSELGGGMACWYKYRFIVEPESILASTVARVAGGCNFLGYYMFHDGTNPIGKHGYLNERVVPKISYNFQAPIGEYGQIKKSYRLLKPVFYFLEAYRDLLCPMGTVLPVGTESIPPEDCQYLRFAARQKDGCGFIFLVNYQDHVTLPDRENTILQLNLPGEVITIPAGNGFTLKRNVSAILPFNLKFGSMLLKYATAQLVVCIAETYFFFSPEGMDSQYCFDASGIAAIDVQHGSVAWAGGLASVSVEPGTGCVITLTGHNGETLRICTLTSVQALNLWKFGLWGQDRLVLSNADITVANNCINATCAGSTRITLSIFPCLPGPLATQFGSVEGHMDGIFSTFEIELPAVDAIIDVRMAGTGSAVVQVQAGWLEQLDDLLLCIDYLGSVGNAFIDGTLVADNFCNGEVWEIGLKRLCPALLEKGLYLHIIPYQKDSEVVFEPGIEFRHPFDDSETARIFSIHAVPVYSAHITQLEQ